MKISKKELKEVIREAISEVVLEANKEPLWTKETAKDTIKQIKKGLKNAVPYLDGIGTGFGGESIIGKISLDDKKTWPNKILENSRWCLIHLHPDGTLDTIRMNGYDSMKERKKVPILRKSKNKSVKQMIDRMGKYFTVVRTKYPKGHLGEGKKLTEGKRQQLEINVMDKLKVDKILKKLRLKPGKDYDIGFGSSRSFILDIEGKHLDKVVTLLMKQRIRTK